MSGAILNTMTPEAKNELLTNSIAKLLEPAQGREYGYDKRTQLQAAFDQACFQTVQQLFREALTTDPVIRQKLDALIKATLSKMLEASTDDLANVMASAFRDALMK